MTTRSCLVFIQREALFAVEASATGEIVHLPELAAIEEAPAHIAMICHMSSQTGVFP